MASRLAKETFDETRLRVCRAAHRELPGTWRLGDSGGNESVLSPRWEDIGRLAAIAASRTSLNYFLEKDLDKANELEAT